MQFLRYHHHLILESVENEILIFFFLSNYFQILMMIFNFFIYSKNEWYSIGNQKVILLLNLFDSHINIIAFILWGIYYNEHKKNIQYFQIFNYYKTTKMIKDKNLIKYLFY